jgi:DNA-binding CsgD family transcriptional regulator
MSATWPFIGREAELGLIAQAMNDPETAGIVLAGHVGVGKTRLAHEALRQADPKHHVILRVAATRATATIPFGALAQLLPAELPAASDRVNLLRLAAEALGTQAGPRRLVVEVDDAHLLDDTSAALLHQLAHGRLAFVLVTLVSGEPAPETVTALWKERLLHRLELQALSRLDVREVLATVLGGQVDSATAERLWQATRGNTLLLRELVVAGLESGSLALTHRVWRWRGPWVMAPRLVELIHGRLGRLDDEERHAVELLAYGEPLGADVLTRAVSLQAVERLEAKGLLWVEQAGRRVWLRLAHPLYSEAVRTRASALRARSRQRELAETFTALGTRRRADTLRVATWQLNSGTALNVGLLVEAARQAWAMFDLPLAERLARTAVDSAGGLPALQVLGDVLLFTDRADEAEAVFKRGALLPASTEERVRFALARAFSLFWGLDRTDEAAALLRETGGEVTDPFWRKEVAALDAAFLVFSGRCRQGLSAAGELLGLPVANERADAQAWLVTGFATGYLGRFTESLAALERARSLAPRWAAELPWLADAIELAAFYSKLLGGDLAGAEVTASAMHATSLKRKEWRFSVATWCIARGQVALFRGHVGDALRWGREGRGLFSLDNSAGLAFVCHAELAVAAAQGGDPRLAEEAMALAEATTRRSQGLLAPWVALARPWLAAVRGALLLAADLAMGAAVQARELGAVAYEALALHDAVRFGAAARATRRLDELAASGENPLILRYAEHAAALLRRDGKALDTIADAFEAAGADLLAAETAAEASRMHQLSGRSAKARAAAARSAYLARACKGVRTPALEVLAAPTLTPREREIAMLAAAGLSNRAIADQVTLSVRTVDNHLHQVYAKLGIAGRAELRRVLEVQPFSSTPAT